MRGRDKLLEIVDGVPQLRRAIDAARKGGIRKVWVTLQPGDTARRPTLTGSWAKVVEVPGWDEGIAASLRAGAQAILPHRPSGLLILLADLPEITADDISRFVIAHAEHPEAIWRGTAEDGTSGHPVLLPASMIPGLLDLKADEGARAILNGKGADVRPLQLPGFHANLDLDTPEAWSQWRAKTGR